ncbi:MAG: PAS domain S-box protein [Thermodesulfovibrionales bacterium]
MYRIKKILELIREILYIQDLETLLYTIAVQISLLLNTKGSIVRILEGNELRVKAAIGVDKDLYEKITVKIGEGIAGRVYLEQRTIVVNNPEEFGMISPIIGIKNALCAPIKTTEKLLGTFGVFDKHDSDGNLIDYTAVDVYIFEEFTMIASVIIEKLYLYEQALKKDHEVSQEKQRSVEITNFLHSIINNSADAIITTDLNRNILSWNIGAENIYGYTLEEVLHKPFMLTPDFMFDIERIYTERVKSGETLKHIETVHMTKDKSLIDVSITMSPIKDADARVIGISMISRDITNKKKIERELIRKNDMLNRLIFISSAMRSTLNLERLIRMILTAVTMGDGFGFNRAMLFLVDEEKNVLKGAMGVGPSSHEEAWRIWSTISIENKNLYELIDEIEKGPLKKDSFMDKMCCNIEIPLDEDSILTKVIKNKTAYNVKDVYIHDNFDDYLVKNLGSNSYAVIPLISMDKVIGVLWVDNLFSRRQITDDDIEYLKGFTSQIASAIENAKLFQRVYEAEKELENIFESIDDMLYVTDNNLVIRKVNKSVLKNLNLQEWEVIGKKSFEVFSESIVECETKFRTVLKEDTKALIEEIEDTISHNTYLVSCSPIIGPDGEVSGTVHIVRNITEMKRLREQLATNERMAALGEIAAKVAHEIRNPLLSIGGFAMRLERKLDDELKDYARIIVEEVRRLEHILNDTLSFAKSSRLQKSKVRLNDILEGIISLLEPVVQEKNNKIIKEFSDDILLCVNPDRFREALINIITNANHFTENGLIKVNTEKRQRIIIDENRNSKNKNEVIISISDTGCGIKKEDIDRIFDPFFTTRTNGTGLGLSITKKIIEEHDGFIEVQSTFGEGTTFKIYISCEEE